MSLLLFTAGILSITNEPVNPREAANVTCTIRRPEQLDRNSRDVMLTLGSRPVSPLSVSDMSMITGILGDAVADC